MVQTRMPIEKSLPSVLEENADLRDENEYLNLRSASYQDEISGLRPRMRVLEEDNAKLCLNKDGKKDLK